MTTTATYTIRTSASHQATAATKAEAHELAARFAGYCQRTTITGPEGYRFTFINRDGSIMAVAA